MGEIADAMLDGTLCEGCGGYLEGEGEGYPVRCADCQRDDRARDAVVKALGDSKVHAAQARAQAMTSCPTCGKPVKIVGLAQHMSAKHP